MSGGVLTIETGLACNNRCAFCPQVALRGCGPGADALTTAEVRDRVLAARREGFEEVAFTGG